MTRDEEIRQIEMDFFQGRADQAIERAVAMVSSMDMDDDDDAQAAEGLMLKALGSDKGVDFVGRLAATNFDFGIRFPDGETITTMLGAHGRSDPAVLRALVDAGADPFSCNRAGSNALHLLASIERSNFAKNREGEMAEIVRATDDVSGWMVCNAYGATPLHLAVLFKHIELATSLLEMGADPDAVGEEVRQGYGHAVDFNGITPLDVACIIGDDSAAELLISHGADPLHTDYSGRTPAHYAVMQPPQSICREWDSIPGMEAIAGRKRNILAKVGGLDAVDDAGTTPLMIALTRYRYQNGGLSEALLELGASPNIAANDGTTPLMAAVSNGLHDAVKALVAAGADLDACDSHGRTALHHAISWRDEKSARLLVKKGARFDIPDDKGVTAGEMAASAGMESVMELMVRGD